MITHKKIVQKIFLKYIEIKIKLDFSPILNKNIDNISHFKDQLTKYPSFSSIDLNFNNSKMGENTKHFTYLR